MFRQHRLKPGVVVGDRYRIVEHHSGDDWADVYDAWDEHAMRRRLVSVASFPSLESLTRFRRECHALLKLQHPNVANPLRYGELGDGRTYYVTDYVAAERVDLFLLRDRSPSLATAISIIEQLIDVVAAADRCGILHRAISTRTILLRQDEPRDADPRILLSGFGYVKIRDPAYSESARVTTYGPPTPDPPYIATEIFDGKSHTIQSEMFAIGAVGYELLAGTAAYPRATFQTRKARQGAPIAPLHDCGRDVPCAVADVIMRCLADDPSSRFASIAELNQAFVSARGSGLEREEAAASFHSAAVHPKPLDAAFYRETARRIVDDGRGNAALRETYHDVLGAEFIVAAVDETLVTLNGQLARAIQLQKQRRQAGASTATAELAAFVERLERQQVETESERNRRQGALAQVGQRLQELVTWFAADGLSADTRRLLDEIRNSGSARQPQSPQNVTE